MHTGGSHCIRCVVLMDRSCHGCGHRSSFLKWWLFHFHKGSGNSLSPLPASLFEHASIGQANNRTTQRTPQHHDVRALMLPFTRVPTACVSSPRDWAVSNGSHMQQDTGNTPAPPPLPFTWFVFQSALVRCSSGRSRSPPRTAGRSTTPFGWCRVLALTGLAGVTATGPGKPGVTAVDQHPRPSETNLRTTSDIGFDKCGHMLIHRKMAIKVVILQHRPTEFKPLVDRP